MKTNCLSYPVGLFCWRQQKDQSIWNSPQDGTCVIMRDCAWFILSAFTPFGFCTFLTCYLNNLFHTFFIQALAKHIFVQNILHSKRDLWMICTEYPFRFADISLAHLYPNGLAFILTWPNHLLNKLDAHILYLGLWLTLTVSFTNHNGDSLLPSLCKVN